MGKVYLLRPESITPIARHLERRDRNPDSFAIQLEFAVALLYREREYRAMHQVSWFSGTVPAPSAENPFAPYDLTDEAAAILALFLRESQTNAFNESLAQPDDLFGLKSDAADGLGRTLRPIQSHRFGWLVYWRLLTDLRLPRKAAAAARRAAALGEPTPKK